jgi:hypothetical protein
LFRTSQHPLLNRAVQQAETLHRFRIMPAMCGVMLWHWRDGWKLLHPFASREVAEDYLLSKLPCIESEM